MGIEASCVCVCVCYLGQLGMFSGDTDDKDHQNLYNFESIPKFNLGK